MIWLIAAAAAAVVGTLVTWALGARAGQLDDAAGMGDKHPFTDRCVHGVQFGDDCDDCPDGCPQITGGPQ